MVTAAGRGEALADDDARQSAADDAARSSHGSRRESATGVGSLCAAR